MRRHHRAPKVPKGWLYSTKDGIVTPQGSCNSYARLTPSVWIGQVRICMHLWRLMGPQLACMPRACLCEIAAAIETIGFDVAATCLLWATIGAVVAAGLIVAELVALLVIDSIWQAAVTANATSTRERERERERESAKASSKQSARQRAGRQSASSLAFCCTCTLRGGRAVVIIPFTRGIEARLVTIAVALPR